MPKHPGYQSPNLFAIVGVNRHGKTVRVVRDGEKMKRGAQTWMIMKGYTNVTVSRV